jgi:hypothetical protein
MSASGVLAELDQKKEYLGTVVGPTMPGYKILKSTLVIVKNTIPTSGHWLSEDGESLVRDTCRGNRANGIGIVNYRESLAIGSGYAVWIFYGDCILNAVPE